MHEELLEERHQGIAVLSKSGELIAANHLFKELAGYVEHEIVPIDVDTLFGGCQKASALSQRDWKLVRTNLTKRDGNSWSMFLCIKAITDDQGADSAYVIRTNEDSDFLRIATKAIGQPVQGIGQLGHDLRNVFTAIVISGLKILEKLHIRSG